jgi:glycosyltransferase involved in cell wall biosynthesis
MRILQICHRIPFPSNDGGSIAMYNLTKAFIADGHTVFMLAINTNKHHVDVKNIEEAFFRTANFQSVDVDTSIQPLQAFLNLFTAKSYNIERFISKAFECKLIELLKKNLFDVVQLESIFVAPYLNTIRKNSAAKVVLRAHNVEYKIWERLAKAAAHPLKKAYLNLLSKRLKKFELGLLNKYDGIAAITEKDADAFKEAECRLPICVIPVGVDLKAYDTPGKEGASIEIFHIGAMDWLPNIEAIQWLLDKVWLPEIAPLNKPQKLFLAGRNMPDWLLNLNSPSVIVEGEVADAKKYMTAKTIMLVPLLSGGGMRVKIAEGMACGKTIISTSIGAEGIPYTNGKNILIADSATEFRDAILYCLENKEACKEIGLQAKTLAQSAFNNNEIGLRLIHFFKKLLPDG